MPAKRAGFSDNVIEVIKAIRKTKGIKQSTMAFALGMTESNYCKIEKQYKELTTKQLGIIAELFGLNVRKLISLADAIHELDLKNRSLEEELIALHTHYNYNLVKDYSNEGLLLILKNVRTQKVIKLAREESFNLKVG